MGYLILDVETTIQNNGCPYDPANKLCTVQLLPEGKEASVHLIEYDDRPYGAALTEIREAVEQADVVVGFNVKFDVAWLRRYGIRVPKVWDLQLAEFLMSGQSNRMPSLAGTLEQYGLPPKGNLAEEYWDKGVDTTQIPLDVLMQYATDDVVLEALLYQKQRELMPPDLIRLFKLQCEDLLVLQEMEHNGLLYDIQEARRMENVTEDEIKAIDYQLDCIVNRRISPPVNCAINLGSSQHLSALLFGGMIPYVGREVVEKPRKDGTIRVYERNVLMYHEVRGWFKPDKKLETVKTRGMSVDDLGVENAIRHSQGKALLHRTYSTDEATIKRLSGQKASVTAHRFLELIQHRAKLVKLQSTYYRGMLELMDRHGWLEEGFIHSSLNQCVAATGRLSSSEPNQQNLAGDVKRLIKSRFESGTKSTLALSK